MAGVPPATHTLVEGMSVWRVRSRALRYLPGTQPVRRVHGRRPPARVPPGAASAGRRPGTSVGRTLGWLLSGYALISVLVAWALATGHARWQPIQALAPVSLVISIFVALGALAVLVFAGNRRNIMPAVGILGLSVGVAVASAGALVTAGF